MIFNADGRLASGSLDDIVRIWDPVTGEHIHSLEGHSDCVLCVGFSKDGITLACGVNDKKS